MANNDMCLEAAQKAFPNDEKMRVAYMLGFNEGYDRANEQPSLPSNLDEAAEEIASDIAPTHPDIGWDECFEKIKDGIKAGAEWMTKQGFTKETKVYANRWTDVDKITVSLGRGGEYGFIAGDEVTVQIRKKGE